MSLQIQNTTILNVSCNGKVGELNMCGAMYYRDQKIKFIFLELLIDTYDVSAIFG